VLAVLVGLVALVPVGPEGSVVLAGPEGLVELAQLYSRRQIGKFWWDWCCSVLRWRC